MCACVAMGVSVGVPAAGTGGRGGLQAGWVGRAAHRLRKLLKITEIVMDLSGRGRRGLCRSVRVVMDADSQPYTNFTPDPTSILHAT